MEVAAAAAGGPGAEEGLRVPEGLGDDVDNPVPLLDWIVPVTPRKLAVLTSTTCSSKTWLQTTTFTNPVSSSRVRTPHPMRSRGAACR